LTNIEISYIILNVIKRRAISLSNKSVVILPQTQKILNIMGEQIKMARLRRKLSAKLIAERAGISAPTLWSIEKGSPRVSIGAYAAVLHALNNMDKDMLLIAHDDELGKKLQDLALQTKRRAPKRQAESIEK
jgi:transcriptional regulator with XRE-family HTH domain